MGHLDELDKIIESRENGNLRVVYVGESGRVKYRILNNHCFGNVDVSALRRSIAKYVFKYEVRKEKCNNKNAKFLINPLYELEITKYVLSGFWKVIFIDDRKEAKDFQYFLINKLKPLLNRMGGIYDTSNEKIYKKWFESLENAPLLSYKEILELECGTGVYVFYHE